MGNGNRPLIFITRKMRILIGATKISVPTSETVLFNYIIDQTFLQKI